ncbi:MAG: hypothetical protein SPG04_04880 [Candidatus Heritagella sp.]|nr:hypothetical protein [Candidatus Heritagella sp.]
MGKPTGIVYTSNTGYTEKYAKLLGEQLGLPAFSAEQADSLPEGTEVLYLGWLMAGVVKGYKKAAQRFSVAAVCGVGMGPAGSQDSDVRKNNAIPQEVPVFTLQGGFDRTKLHGIYRFMMGVMIKVMGSSLRKKENRTPEEDAMLEMVTNGGDFVDVRQLDGVIAWYRQA